AFTGFLVETNFESQWIAFESKDGLNAVGVGAWFNVADTAQMLLIHVALLPVLVAGLIVWHVLLVRHRGVVPPIPLRHPPVTAHGQDDKKPVTP
ncbi:MAG: hypothetical protein ABI776_17365, partial [Nocardioidaceae bacterium]